jgi:CRP-like cAMP-binding protein
MHTPVTKKSAKVEVLKNNGYFSGLEKKILEDLAQGTSLRRYERGEIIFWEGEPCSGLYIIQHGSVKLFKTSRQVRELIINVFEEGLLSTRYRSSITYKIQSMWQLWRKVKFGSWRQM